MNASATTTSPDMYYLSYVRGSASMGGRAATMLGGGGNGGQYLLHALYLLDLMEC